MSAVSAPAFLGAETFLMISLWLFAFLAADIQLFAINLCLLQDLERFYTIEVLQSVYPICNKIEKHKV